MRTSNGKTIPVTFQDLSKRDSNHALPSLPKHREHLSGHLWTRPCKTQRGNKTLIKTAHQNRETIR